MTLLLLWLPIATPIYLLGTDQNLVSIMAMGVLFTEFLLLLKLVWGPLVYQQSRIFVDYGLERTRQNFQELLIGLGIGLLMTFSLFTLEGLLGWLEFRKQQVVMPRLILEGLASAVGIAFAEELFFRGWLLDELQRDYSLKVSLWVDAIIFAVLHFLKPLSEIIRTLAEFPGLLLLGLTLVWAKRISSRGTSLRYQGRLGLPIGLHAGLVWGYYIISVGQLVKYSDQVAPWITGINGNPIAGFLGWLFMGVLALWIRKRSSMG
ncbi:MAG: CPBP family intramembrane metalloprotease [Symploca sp. SIO3C6]|nr:CPBP family intramembrane metalloprotease [Symploca sp. SIO3C6]